jgi:hypothetical protein
MRKIFPIKSIFYLLFFSLTVLGCNSKVDKPSSTFLLSESKLKFEDNKMQLSVKAKNNSSDISKGYVCVRLYDKDNSELEQFTGQEVSLNGDKEGNYSGEKQIELYKFEQISNAKIYVAKFGCTNLPEEAISNIEIVDKNNISFTKAEAANNSSSASQKTQLDMIVEWDNEIFAECSAIQTALLAYSINSGKDISYATTGVNRLNEIRKIKQSANVLTEEKFNQLLTLKNSEIPRGAIIPAHRTEEWFVENCVNKVTEIINNRN